MEIPDNYKLKYPWLSVNDVHDVKCCLCDGTNETKNEFAFSINDKEFFIRHCIHDNLLFLYPQPEGQYTDNLYNHSSYWTGEDDMYGLAVSDEKSSAVANFRVQEIVDYLEKSGRTLQGKSILEIGCAYGHTLVEARKRGAVITDGIEFSKEATLVCNKKDGLHVVLGSANDAFQNTLPNKTYEIIAMYSVLEHVNNPAEFIKRVVPLLSPGGIVVIRVPEMSKDGPWLSLVDHFWHFTRESITAVLGTAKLTQKTIFPSGLFIGSQHPGKLQSITIIAEK